MKDQILKMAGVKSEKEFYKKFPTEEAFMAKYGKKLEKAAMGKAMVNKQLHQLTEWDNPAMAQDGGSWANFGIPAMSTATYDASTGLVNNASGVVSKSDTTSLGFDKTAPGAGGGAGASMAAAGLQSIGQVISGVEAMHQQTQNIRKAGQAKQLSGLALQAQQTMQKPKRKYVRPEDNLVQPGQLGNPYGTGTNYLAQNGTRIGGNPTEIQNMYNPGDIYLDGGYEPLDDSQVKQFKKGGYLPEAEFGEYFQDSGQAQIGSAIGGTIGAGIGGPAGQMVGQLIGKVAGNLLGGAKDARELAKNKAATELNQQQTAFAQAQQNQFGSFMKYGGEMDSEHKWVSNGWQPQTFTKFGEYSAKQLLAPPKDADMLRAGGHLREYTPPSAEAMFTGRPDMPHAQFGFAIGAMNKDLMNIVQNSEQANKLKQAASSGMMDNGGRMTSTNMMFDTDKYPRAEYGQESDLDGDLEIIEGGKAETMSFNPYLPEGGETVMFKGRSHDDGGIPINYGANGVEVEGGEPAVKLKDGGENSNMVVFGNMKISDMAAKEIGDPKAKGMKYKRYIADLSNVEKKQNKIIDKAVDLANNSQASSAFDQLSLNTSNLMLKGADMKLKDIAFKKMQAATVQNAILDTASELGVKSDKLAEGKIEKEHDPRMMAKYGKKLKKAQSGDYEYFAPVEQIDYTSITPEFIDETGGGLENSPVNKMLPTFDAASKTGFGQKALQALKATGKTLGKGIDKYGPTVLSNVSPWLRPSNQEPLDPEQLYPEYFALATNQLEPVQAQTYNPMLDTPYDISLNDQINAVDSQANAAIRAAGNNPAAQAQIMAQALDAKNRIKGEQTRINQANKMQVYDKNRALLNDAQLRNLQILDQQYVRQAQAKSATKEQAFNALSSIAAKVAQKKLENKTLGLYENLYNYRFSPSGRAYSVNDPYQFTMPNFVGKTPEELQSLAALAAKEKSKKSRNGSIVQALKNI